MREELPGICSGTITRCVNKGNIATAVRMAQNNVGGIAGLLQGSDAVIRYCENKASVQGYFTVGGLQAPCALEDPSGTAVTGGKYRVSVFSEELPDL